MFHLVVSIYTHWVHTATPSHDTSKNLQQHHGYCTPYKGCARSPPPFGCAACELGRPSYYAIETLIRNLSRPWYVTRTRYFAHFSVVRVPESVLLKGLFRFILRLFGLFGYHRLSGYPKTGIWGSFDRVTYQGPTPILALE